MLKFSAMEIYNEAVKDLLGTDGTPLRLLDDPEVNIALDESSIRHCLVFCLPCCTFIERNNRGETYGGNSDGLEPYAAAPFYM